MSRVITFRQQLTSLTTSLTEFTMDEAYLNGAWTTRANPVFGWVLGHRVLKTAGSGTEVTEFNMREGTGGTQRLAYTNTPDPEPFDFIKSPIGRGVWFEVAAPANLKFEISVDTGVNTNVDVEIEIEIPD